MKFSFISKAFIFGFAMATGAVACSSGPGPLDTTGSSAGDTSSVGMELRIGRTTHINTVKYALTGPAGFSATGSVNISATRDIDAVVASVPVGSPYTLSLSAMSTDGNVTCTGSKSGISVTCPGNTEKDEKNVILHCTRNHLGHEWGDDDWRENGRTFIIGTEFKLLCNPGVDAGSDAAKDTGAPDTSVVDSSTPDTSVVDSGSCVKKSCSTAQVCGTIPDGCTDGGTVTCGALGGGCPIGQACTSTNTCKCAPITACPAGDNCGTISDGCGGTIPCGPATCATGQTCTNNVCSSCVPKVTCATVGASCGSIVDDCSKTVQCGLCAAPLPTCQPFTDGSTGGTCVCKPITACAAGECGTIPNGCGGTVTCAVTCSAPQSCGGGGVANQCGCTKTATICPAGDVCGTIADGCGGSVTCGALNGACPTGSTCNTKNMCICVPKPACTGGEQCGTEPDGCGGTVGCGTCSSSQTCDGTGHCVTCSASCPTGDNCGTASNGCGQTLNCGTCSAPTSTCSVPDGGTAGTCICVPQARSVTCGSATCGKTVDNCGNPVDCGSCTVSPNLTCVPTADGGSLGTCGCASQPVAVTCGANHCGNAVDNCGKTVQCGTCAAGNICSVADGGTAGTCVPTVVCPTTCPAGQTCGAFTQAGCPTLNCGTCTPPNTCGPNSTCVPPPNPCDPVTGSTNSCIQSFNKPGDNSPSQCFACAQANGCLDPASGGGSCEALGASTASLLAGALPDGKTCSQVVGSSTLESSVCFETLQTINRSACGATFQLTPCLCGLTDTGKCIAGTATPTGAAFDLYACDFNTTNGSTINSISSNFNVPTFGAGQANALMGCAGAFNCNCF